MTYQAVPFTTTFSNAPNLDFKVTQFIDALDVLCAQLTRGLFAIAKFLVLPRPSDSRLCKLVCLWSSVRMFISAAAA